MSRGAGFAAVDYLGAVIIVALLMAALVAVRAHEVSRRPPVNPAKPLAALVAKPLIRSRPTPTRRRARPSRPSRPRRSEPPMIVDAPRWLGGR